MAVMFQWCVFGNGVWVVSWVVLTCLLRVRGDAQVFVLISGDNKRRCIPGIAYCVHITSIISTASQASQMYKQEQSHTRGLQEQEATHQRHIDGKQKHTRSIQAVTRSILERYTQNKKHTKNIHTGRNKQHASGIETGKNIEILHMRMIQNGTRY